MDVRNLRSRARPGGLPILATAVVGALVAVGSLVGCGTASGPGTGSGSGSPAHPAKATLTIRLTDKAAGLVKHWTLRCAPVGGTAPNPAGLCRVLFKNKHALGPIMPRIMCPQILVSGRQIIVDGTWYGRKVHRVIIDGGCDLPIFNSMEKMFGEAPTP